MYVVVHRYTQVSLMLLLSKLQSSEGGQQLTKAPIAKDQLCDSLDAMDLGGSGPRLKEGDIDGFEARLTVLQQTKLAQEQVTQRESRSGRRGAKGRAGRDRVKGRGNAQDPERELMNDFMRVVNEQYLECDVRNMQVTVVDVADI
jgi:hypothetical protein